MTPNPSLMTILWAANGIVQSGILAPVIKANSGPSSRHYCRSCKYPLCNRCSFWYLLCLCNCFSTYFVFWLAYSFSDIRLCIDSYVSCVDFRYAPSSACTPSKGHFPWNSFAPALCIWTFTFLDFCSCAFLPGCHAERIYT